MRSSGIAGLAVSVATLAALAQPARAQTKSEPARADTIVFVWEDAPLFTAPDDSATNATANRPVIPRARRPFLLVKRMGLWVRLQSFTTADVRRMPVCPLPGLTDLQVHLYARASDIAESISIDSLPKRLGPVMEYQLDACRNPNAKMVATPPAEDDPRYEPPDLEAPPVGIGPYLAPKTALYWEDGRAAGRARYSIPLPINTYRHEDRLCFDRPLQGPGAFGQASASLRLCAVEDQVRRR